MPVLRLLFLLWRLESHISPTGGNVTTPPASCLAFIPHSEEDGLCGGDVVDFLCGLLELSAAIAMIGVGATMVGDTEQERFRQNVANALSVPYGRQTRDRGLSPDEQEGEREWYRGRISCCACLLWFVSIVIVFSGIFAQIIEACLCPHRSTAYWIGVGVQFFVFVVLLLGTLPCDGWRACVLWFVCGCGSCKHPRPCCYRNKESSNPPHLPPSTATGDRFQETNDVEMTEPIPSAAVSEQEIPLSESDDLDDELKPHQHGHLEDYF